MHRPALPSLARPLSALAIAAASLAAATPALAANHALIMWVGEYSNPRNNLPGIDKDAAMARKIARGMGVPEGNIQEMNNSGVTRSSVGQALRNMASRIAQGDKVFLYYSGHGGQITNASGNSKCTEGIVTSEGNLYEDFLMEDALKALGNKAAQLVMMNDSCFSGGAASKSRNMDNSNITPKFYPDLIKATTVADGDYQCGNAINKQARNLSAVGNAPNGPNVLYIAAASAVEVAGATPRGSLATLAWSSCLGADPDRSGSVTGKEFQDCAQRYVNDQRARQTITLTGNMNMSLMFTNDSGSASGSSAVNPVAALRDIQASGQKDYRIDLRADKTRLRIGQDYLDFNVTTNREGYLYVLHVGSDGKTFDVLYPNGYDRNNFLRPGTHTLPRNNSWRVRVGGPAGTSHLLAIVSPLPKDVSKGMDLSSAFPSTPSTARAVSNLDKTLYVEAGSGSGNGSGGSHFGTSNILSLEEY